MGKTKATLSLKQREEGLIKLVDDAVAMRFNRHLISKYKRQLREVKKRLDEEKEERKRIIERIKEDKKNGNVQ